MRLTYLAGSRIPSRDANSVQTAKMCEAFAEIGHDVTLFARSGDAPAATIFERYGVRQNFSFRALPRRGVKGTHTALFMVEMVRSVRSGPPPEVFFGRDIVSLAAVAHLHAPLIYEAHRVPEPGSIQERVLTWLVKRPNFARLVCTTTTLKAYFADKYGDRIAAMTLVLPNAASELPSAPALADWPGREGRFQVGFVGRPFPGKGIEMVWAAADGMPDSDFHIVGAARNDVGWMGAEPPANLVFHDYVPHAALGGFYKRFDTVVAPYGSIVMNASGMESAQITSPLKILEYYAAGLPVVTTRLPGILEVVEDGQTALLTPPDDTAAFLAALIRLRDDPDLRSRMGAAARKRYLERHTTQARARSVLAGVAG